MQNTNRRIYVNTFLPFHSYDVNLRGRFWITLISRNGRNLIKYACARRDTHNATTTKRKRKRKKNSHSPFSPCYFACRRFVFSLYLLLFFWQTCYFFFLHRESVSVVLRYCTTFSYLLQPNMYRYRLTGSQKLRRFSNRIRFDCTIIGSISNWF